MEEHLMTLKEVAELTKLDEEAVQRLVQEGRLRAQKTARQLQFRRADVDAWMADPRRCVPANEQQVASEAAGSPEPPTVTNTLCTNRIKLNLKATDRDGILRELVPLVIDPQDERGSEVLFKALKEREDMCSTCVTEGVAVPHSRNALVGLVSRPVLAYGRHRRGVAFGALDGKPIHHFFLLCAPNVREHLQLLARLARLINKPEFRDGLMTAESPDQLMALIQRMEQY